MTMEIVLTKDRKCIFCKEIINKGETAEYGFGFVYHKVHPNDKENIKLLKDPKKVIMAEIYGT